MLKKTPLRRGNSKLKKSPLKKGGSYIIKSRPKSEEEILYKKQESEKMRMFFLKCWQELPHRSEIGPEYKYLGEQPLTLFFHHVWEKSTHPEIKYSISNILRVTGDEHSCLNNDLEYFDEAKQKREWVRANWEYCIKESLMFEEEFANVKNKI